MARTVAVIGASLGGLRAAEQLRSQGWGDRVVVVGEEPYMPYNRPPLSKNALRQQIKQGNPRAACRELAASVAFRLRPSISDIEWWLGQSVVAARLDDQVIELADGTAVEFDGLVVATGLRPRRLLTGTIGKGIHALRTVEDAIALRADLGPSKRVVVIGAGFIGCEVAASARKLGCHVSVVESFDTPMVAALGPQLGAAIQANHVREGVQFYLGRRVSAVDKDECGSVRSVDLDDETTLRCEVLIEAIGSIPNVEWLEGNGLDLTDGLLCDGWLRVEGRSNIVAVGDVARFPNALYDEVPRRVEHWCVPTDTARRAVPSLVAALLGQDLDPTEFAPLASFWSDQFDLRIQGLGAFGLAEKHVLLEGNLKRIEEGVVLGALRGERLVGVVGVALRPSAIRHYRELLTTVPECLPSPRAA